jgi:succinate dehydrogenase/fumarate reductase flavoprotein subunit
MQSDTVRIQGIEVPIHAVNTLVIGSGAASLKAAVSLHERGQHDVAIVTEKWGSGASNNSGSDKQTYYKLSLAGAVPDSPLEMARDLFQGGCMHGDIALCEAQHSAQVFYELTRLGVPFPHDRYGGYPGYRTDHDRRGRATSAGPLTSHFMFQALAQRVAETNIPILDRHPVIALFTDGDGPDKKIIGAAVLNLNELDRDHFGLVLFNAVNVVFGTGGPGGLYEMSVYPEDQCGSIGLALEIGAVAHNLTESQFGLASIRYRWNVSGSYQQVLPRYVSTAENGKDERDFLADCFPDMETMALAIFRKGYQWPFDPRKIAGFGSSLIDLLVYRETALRGRRVFLDFMHNPTDGEDRSLFDIARIPDEAKEYLQKSRALQATPIERLACLNQKAIDLYRDHGIDLSKEYLEIAVCAQHNNGGLRANHWWESNVKHLFPVGEVNGTHGVYRPGGAALNAGQVGGLRAAMFITLKYRSAPPEVSSFVASSQQQIRAILERIRRWRTTPAQTARPGHSQYLAAIRRRMSRHGAHIRNPEGIRGAIEEAWHTFHDVDGDRRIEDRSELPLAFKTRDLALTHAVYLEAIGAYMDQGGKSRGSYLITDPGGNQLPSGMDDAWRFSINEEDAFVNHHILELSLDSEYSVRKRWVAVRPIPTVDLWFENVWREYLNGEIYAETEE